VFCWGVCSVGGLTLLEPNQVVSPIPKQEACMRIRPGYVDGLNEIPISIDKAPMTADRLDRPMTLIVRSSLEFQIEVAEILAWLTAAIRTSDSPEMKLSSALLSLRNCCEESTGSNSR